MIPYGLAALVVKTGVSLGGLRDDERDAALAIAAMSLAPGEAVSEADVNGRLKRCLASQACFLATDHVELRRWLVDSRWWRRDAPGRLYERSPPEALAGEQQALTRALAPLDLAAWVAERRSAAQAERERRRAAWHAKASGGGA